MPFGENFYWCAGCRQRKICGDCIPTLCAECRRKEEALRSEGWRTIGYIAGEYLPPGTKTYTLPEAFEAMTKGRP